VHAKFGEGFSLLRLTRILRVKAPKCARGIIVERSKNNRRRIVEIFGECRPSYIPSPYVLLGGGKRAAAAVFVITVAVSVRLIISWETRSIGRELFFEVNHLCKMIKGQGLKTRSLSGSRHLVWFGL
jgi:hypothetical protein